MIDKLKNHSKVLTEHLWLEKDAKDTLSDEEIFKRDVAWIDEADLVIAEVSTPSLGVGWELAYAESKGIQIVALYNEKVDRALSAMITGNEYINVIVYQSLEDAFEQLQVYL